MHSWVFMDLHPCSTWQACPRMHQAFCLFVFLCSIFLDYRQVSRLTCPPHVSLHGAAFQPYESPCTPCSRGIVLPRRSQRVSMRSVQKAPQVNRRYMDMPPPCIHHDQPDKLSTSTSLVASDTIRLMPDGKIVASTSREWRGARCKMFYVLCSITDRFYELKFKDSMKPADRFSLPESPAKCVFRCYLLKVQASTPASQSARRVTLDMASTTASLSEKAAPCLLPHNTSQSLFHIIKIVIPPYLTFESSRVCHCAKQP
jgi:hypothetical protein